MYFKVNTGLTQKIFDWYLAHPTAKKFIQFSTVKSAADRVEGEFHIVKVCFGRHLV